MSDRTAIKRGEHSLEFLLTYLEDENKRRQQETVDSSSIPTDGQNNQTSGSGYRLHHQLRNSLKDFTYQDVPTIIRNRLKECKSHRLRMKDIQCEVYDWVFQHLEEKKCPYSLAVALASQVAKASLAKLLHQPATQVASISSTSSPPSESQAETGIGDGNSSTPSSLPSQPSLPLHLQAKDPNENPIGFVADSNSLKKESLELLFSICADVACKGPAEAAQLCDQFSTGLLSSTSAIRNARRSMEDRHVVIHDLNKICNINSAKQYSYYAVFDGHAGVDAATYAASHLHQNLVSSQAFRDGDMVDALQIAFNVTDADFLERSALTSLKSGCTAICCLKEGTDRLFFAWAGDSQAILVRDGRPIDLTPAHKPDVEQERNRIEQMGGKVIKMDTWRVDGTLAVSRAIGDPDHKPYVTANPEVVVVDLEKGDDFIVIACDGLWDQITPEEATQIVYEHLEQSDATDPEEAGHKVAAKLVEYAKREGSMDNITTIVVFLKDIQSIVSTGKSEYFTMELSNQSAGSSNNNTSLDFLESGTDSFTRRNGGLAMDDATAEEELFSLTHNQLNELEEERFGAVAAPASVRMIGAEALSPDAVSSATAATAAARNGYPDDVMSHDDASNLMNHFESQPMMGSADKSKDLHSAIHSSHDSNMNNNHKKSKTGHSSGGEDGGWDAGRGSDAEGGVSGEEAVLLPTRTSTTFVTDEQQQAPCAGAVASVTKELEELVDEAASSAGSSDSDQSDTDSVQYLVWESPKSFQTGAKPQTEVDSSLTSPVPFVDPLQLSQRTADMSSRPESPVKSSSRPQSPAKLAQSAVAPTKSGSRPESPSASESPARRSSPIRASSRSSSPSKSNGTGFETNAEKRSTTPIQMTKFIEIDNLIDTSGAIPIPVTITSTSKSPSPGWSSPSRQQSASWRDEESVLEEYYVEEEKISEEVMTETTTHHRPPKSASPFKTTSFADADFAFDKNSMRTGGGEENVREKAEVHEERFSFPGSTTNIANDHLRGEEAIEKEEAYLFNPFSSQSSASHQESSHLFGDVNGHKDPDDSLFFGTHQERKDMLSSDVNGDDPFALYSPSSATATAQDVFSSSVSGKTGAEVDDFVETVTESSTTILKHEWSGDEESKITSLSTSDVAGLSSTPAKDLFRGSEPSMPSASEFAVREPAFSSPSGITTCHPRADDRVMQASLQEERSVAVEKVIERRRTPSPTKPIDLMREMSDALNLHEAAATAAKAAAASSALKASTTTPKTTSDVRKTTTSAAPVQVDMKGKAKIVKVEGKKEGSSASSPASTAGRLKTMTSATSARVKSSAVPAARPAAAANTASTTASKPLSRPTLSVRPAAGATTSSSALSKSGPTATSARVALTSRTTKTTATSSTTTTATTSRLNNGVANKATATAAARAAPVRTTASVPSKTSSLLVVGSKTAPGNDAKKVAAAAPATARAGISSRLYPGPKPVVDVPVVANGVSKPLASKTSTSSLRSAPKSSTTTRLTAAPAPSKTSVAASKTTPAGASRVGLTSTASKPLAAKVSTARLTPAAPAAKTATSKTTSSAKSSASANRTAMMTLKKSSPANPLKSSGSTEPKAVKKVAKTETVTESVCETSPVFVATNGAASAFESVQF